MKKQTYGNLAMICVLAAASMLQSCVEKTFGAGSNPDNGNPILKKPIAASYPHDIGIEKDPHVLYVEKFDDGMPKILSRYSDVLNKEGMSVASDVPTGSRKGSHSLKITSIGGVNSGGHLFRKFNPGFDSVVYIRYYVKYPLISKGYTHHEGVWFGGYNPSLTYPFPRAGICGLGDSRISVSYEPVSQTDMNTYLYWGGMKSWNGGSSCYGNAMIHNPAVSHKVPWDKWTCVEVMLKLNNPVSASNGELRIWQDGVEIGHWGPGFPRGRWEKGTWHYDEAAAPFKGFRWRTNKDLNINYIWIEYYHDKSPEEATHYILFDNLIVADRYIGPIEP